MFSSIIPPFSGRSPHGSVQRCRRPHRESHVRAPHPPCTNTCGSSQDASVSRISLLPSIDSSRRFTPVTSEKQCCVGWSFAMGLDCHRTLPSPFRVKRSGGLFLLPSRKPTHPSKRVYFPSML